MEPVIESKQVKKMFCFPIGEAVVFYSLWINYVVPPFHLIALENAACVVDRD